MVRILQSIQSADAGFVMNPAQCRGQIEGGAEALGQIDLQRRRVVAAGQEVETLRFTTASGTTALDLTGNELAQTITGNAGANRLDGGAGADSLTGLGGDDTYVVDHGGDVVDLDRADPHVAQHDPLAEHRAADPATDDLQLVV